MPELPFPADVVARHHADGAWSAETIADLVARNDPDRVAFHAPEGTITWGQYDDLSSRLARSYLDGGFVPGDRLAVLLTGGALTHVAYLAAQKAGLVTVGIGPRAGDAEVTHLLKVTGAAGLATAEFHRGRSGADIAARCGARRHVLLDLADVGDARWTGPGLGPDDLFFLNSTSGTTGVPKCVRQTMNNRKYFGPLAHAAGRMGPDEVFASVLPAPYGFGLWSAHVVPARYGYPTVLSAEFDAAATLRLIEEHRVTVLCAVTAQFIMLLNDPSFAATDLSSLRVLFTGGERVPASRAAEFEERTGCAVLQFYGSNEAGPISVTTVDDPRERRLSTAGRPIPAMHVRLVGERGQVAANGPGCTPGYLDDPAANAALFRDDGWLLTGDLGAVDDEGYLTITGRAADFIIRGGHNVSALVVEEAVATHPLVAQVAVVAAPDPVLGERVCAYVAVRGELTLDDLREHLDAGGVSKQNWPEHLVPLDGLPIGTGGKVDKAALRTDAARRFG
ncbi:class I adenylate-forming enzyme family protein [Dactylosporangium sucinum]|uniref:2,3-dihydroxybenzoate-AMP ligase n=1 Tax=Dactylosporangium sucinum TaxID=1424081 RepID=A0A917U3J3_9ACTN|nr:class I adenylate-forming enzyme family protein [Dactylosporangium sucinum]GGM54704.1 2,3-dihydroxybenzoate-AMP ligase [Dactylosporangium sucinum]